MNALPERKTGRLPHYNYSAVGTYFITVCTQTRRHTLGCVVGGGVLDAPYVRLSKYGTIAEQTLLEMVSFYEGISVDEYVVMPNHVHFILTIHENVGSSGTPTPTNARIPAFLSTWKRLTNRKACFPLWQRSYYDHILRSEADYLRARQYISHNPACWAEDEYNME